VLIPVFPGSTGEYELEKQFREAGAEVSISLFRTKTGSDIEDSFKELIAAVNGTDILAIPSGMSAGAEPDGSSKIIAMILRHHGVKDAISRLLKNKKGLILGIGEGFKALLKTGLIQTESVQDTESGDIVLAKNDSNRYDCSLKTVKFEQVESPWLDGMVGELETVPVSGLDNAIYMSDGLYSDYLEKGQIATRYAGEQCNGENAACPVEAMISKNGLVLGRVGLVENLRRGLYSNVFDAKESRIFKNAVRYVTAGMT